VQVRLLGPVDVAIAGVPTAIRADAGHPPRPHQIKDAEEYGNTSWWCPLSLCAAEIFALVMGGSNGQPRVDILQLPEVGFQGTTYNPEKVLIDWSLFSWTDVDVLFMEEDIVGCLSPYVRYAQAVSEAVSTLASGPTFTYLVPAARAALADKKKLCPGVPAFIQDKTDLPDYVDSFNAVWLGQQGDFLGGAKNADVNLNAITIIDN
jgi:hypothetical protein